MRREAWPLLHENLIHLADVDLLDLSPFPVGD
jgi:hypothetical protein